MGFEVVVRPVVFPNIRPAPAQPRPPASDSTQGIARINGSSGQFLDLQYSDSINQSSSNPKEVKRRYDTARVYQMDDDGNVNKDNYVDINVVNKFGMKDGRGVASTYSYAPAKEKKNVVIIHKNRIDIVDDPGKYRG
jgi:hypothetical protein